MRVGLFEYLTAHHSPCSDGSMWREGFAMVRAIAADALQAGYHVELAWRADSVPTLAAHLPAHRRLRVVPIEPLESGTSGERAQLFALARRCERVLLIAPEFDDLLLERSRWVEAAAGCLASPGSAFVKVAADKRETLERLTAAGVPVPESCHATDVPGGDANQSWVIKPRYGCGSMDISVVRTPHELARLVEGRDPEAWQVERYCEGMAASVAVICRGSSPPLPLPACRQDLSTDGNLTYRGGAFPLPAELDRRAGALAQAALAALPPTEGYVGVDMVLDPRSRCSSAEEMLSDVVIEINPRLTTSYVGLHALAAENLAPWIFGQRVASDRAPRFDQRSVHFTAAGQLGKAD